MQFESLYDTRVKLNEVIVRQKKKLKRTQANTLVLFKKKIIDHLLFN